MYLMFYRLFRRTERTPLTLWYNTPANATVRDQPVGYKDDPEWLKALPLGNGSLGAMVFGDVHKERIQLNEETVWSGSMQDCDNPEAAKHADVIFQAYTLIKTVTIVQHLLNPF